MAHLGMTIDYHQSQLWKPQSTTESLSTGILGFWVIPLADHPTWKLLSNRYKLLVVIK
jgi:hypothetical protein